MAIYGVGEGWTGALTKQYMQETIPGHDDDNDEVSTPVLLYPYDNVQQVSAGWGSSAFLDQQGQVHVVGRPQDLLSLFRLNRLPQWVRKWAAQSNDPSEITMVGSFISKLIGIATGGDQEEWEVARKYSLLHDWTKVDFTGVGDPQIAHVSCSAGFMAMIGTSGMLYTMGINNRGQCGTGTFSNNVWTPTRVVGLSSQSNRLDVLEQDEPISQVALGFQQGYALSKSGRVYSWGKANRGQLGRSIDADQDASAAEILFATKGRATQIASGMHHGALLTTDHDVYIWGKNMALHDNRPKDALVPERVQGLPNNVLQIACGSHHTAMLLEDGSVFAVGIASDEAVPILDPVMLLPPGTIEFPVRQFAAHHDRTTVIDKQGQVYQAHLWKDESLQEYAAFTPSYVEALLDKGESIQAIHRGWLHTLIVTQTRT